MTEPPKAINEATVQLGEVPMKPPKLATMKSNNYLLNVLLAMAAQDRGGCFGINIRADGTVAEGAVANCALVTKDGALVTPRFDDILSGTTVRKAMELARKHLIGEGKLLREVRQEVVPLSALYDAAEVMMLCGDLGVNPVKELDGKTIGSGEAGPVAVALKRLILQEVYEADAEHIELDYTNPAKRARSA